MICSGLPNAQLADRYADCIKFSIAYKVVFSFLEMFVTRDTMFCHDSVYVL